VYSVASSPNCMKKLGKNLPRNSHPADRRAYLRSQRCTVTSVSMNRSLLNHRANFLSSGSRHRRKRFLRKQQEQNSYDTVVVPIIHILPIRPYMSRQLSNIGLLSL
jgi:hypothetical protein